VTYSVGISLFDKLADPNTGSHMKTTNRRTKQKVTKYQRPPYRPKYRAPEGPEASSDEFIDSRECARLLRCSEKTVWNRRESGELPFIRDGGHVLFHRPTVIESMLRKQRGGNGA
jgi:excisionase family DNA binding protein